MVLATKTMSVPTVTASSDAIPHSWGRSQFRTFSLTVKAPSPQATTTRQVPVGASRQRQGRDPHLPWVSMVSFTRAMNDLFIRSVNKSFRLRSGGMRQNDSGWCSIVSFVPDPSGSKS